MVRDASLHDAPHYEVGGSTPLFIGRCKNERPKHLVLRLRRIDRRDAHAGDALVEHVGAVRRGIAPARKGLGERVVARRNILHRDFRLKASAADALTETLYGEAATVSFTVTVIGACVPGVLCQPCAEADAAPLG